MKIQDTDASRRVQERMLNSGLSVRTVVEEQHLGLSLEDVSAYAIFPAERIWERIQSGKQFIDFHAQITGIVAAAICLGAELEKDRQAND